MIAAYKGHLEIVELLIDFDADITLQDKFSKKA
jgi:ankyrin repeat protein